MNGARKTVAPKDLNIQSSSSYNELTSLTSHTLDPRAVSTLSPRGYVVALKKSMFRTGYIKKTDVNKIHIQLLYGCYTCGGPPWDRKPRCQSTT